MKVLELRDVSRKDSTLHYRREYKGIAVLEARGQKDEVVVQFVVEAKPIGAPEISVSLGADPAWPLLPVVRSIKHIVLELDRQGSLP